MNTVITSTFDPLMFIFAPFDISVLTISLWPFCEAIRSAFAPV